MKLAASYCYIVWELISCGTTCPLKVYTLPITLTVVSEMLLDLNKKNFYAYRKITRSFTLNVLISILKAIQMICALTCHFNSIGCPSGIPYYAPIYSIDTGHRLSYSQYILISCCGGISNCLCLPVCYSINNQWTTISPPSDSGSRSTSGRADEGPRLVTKSQTSYSR